MGKKVLSSLKRPELLWVSSSQQSEDGNRAYISHIIQKEPAVYCRILPCCQQSKFPSATSPQQNYAIHLPELKLRNLNVVPASGTGRTSRFNGTCRTTQLWGTASHHRLLFGHCNQSHPRHHDTTLHCRLCTSAERTSVHYTDKRQHRYTGSKITDHGPSISLEINNIDNQIDATITVY